MKLRIVSESGQPTDTRVMTDDGNDISGCISRISIGISPGACIKADIEVVVGQIDCIVEPMLSHSDLAKLAYAHGYSIHKVVGVCDDDDKQKAKVLSDM